MGVFVDILPGAGTGALAGYGSYHLGVFDGHDGIDGVDDRRRGLPAAGDEVYIQFI